MAKITTSLSRAVDGRGLSEILLRVSVARGKVYRLQSGLFVPPSRWKDGAIVIPRLETAEQLALRETRDRLEDLERCLLDEVAFIDADPKMHYDPRTGEWRATGLEKGTGAASRHLMKLEHIFRAAKLKYNDDDRVLIPRSPFDGIPRNYGQPEGEKALAPEVMQRILSAEAQGVERVALDAFILSFATMGANLADLYAARRFAGPVWCYCRKKITSRRAEMRVTLPPEVAPVLGRLAGRGEWWLGELHRIAGRAELATPKVNAALRRWAAREGLEPFTFYAARKSWATYARNICGIEKATIDEALAHKGDYALADIYITRSWDHLNEANRRVLALFSWEGADPRQEGR